MIDISAVANGEETRRRWREVIRRCLVVSFHSHKGGQGRTLTCAHTAIALATSQLVRPGRSGAPKILLVDLDWEAPGLSYMFRSDTLPSTYKVENEEKHAEEGEWNSIQLITKLYEAVLGDAILQKMVAESDGMPKTERQDQNDLLTALKIKIFGETNVDLNAIALRIITPPVDTTLGSTSANIYLLPAAPIVSVHAAFQAMRFDANILTGLTEAEHPIRGDSLLRLFALLLIDLFKADYLLIDCRAGVTPLGYMVSSRLADVVVVPTTTHNQALDGTRVFKEILCRSTSSIESETVPPYCPEKVIIGVSNVQEDSWDESGDRLQLIEEERRRVFSKLNLSNSSGDRPSDLWFVLPHLRRLGRRERFITPEGESNVIDIDQQERKHEALYESEIKRLSGWISDTWSEKARGFLALPKSNEVFNPSLLRRIIDESDSKEPKTIRILVESGAFGEEPFTKLLDSPISQGLKGKFLIKPVGIDHALLKRIVSENQINNDFRKMPEVYADIPTEDREDIENLDLVAFPHYMLGRLVKNDWIYPLTILEGDQEWTPSVDLTYLRNNFYLAEELCSFAGTLYAFPFSIIRKLLLVRKGFQSTFREQYEQEYKEPLDLNLAGWREIRRALNIAQKNQDGGGVIVVEDDLEHVGIWYDWLEFVYSHGGADFIREGTARGSDYGDCGLNNPATIDGTLAYLHLFWDGLVTHSKNDKGGKDWYHTLDRLQESPDLWMAIAWSDILTSKQWKQLSSDFHCLPFPSAGSKETIIEGWVIGLPITLPKERYELVDAFIRWFLSKEVQEEFVRGGGDSSRKIDLEKLDELSKVLRIVHSAFLPSTGAGGDAEPHVAPKIKFPEAPEVVEEVRKAIKEMVNWPANRQTLMAVAERMDELARLVAKDILKGKSRYVPRKS